MALVIFLHIFFSLFPSHACLLCFRLMFAFRINIIDGDGTFNKGGL